MSPPAAVVAVRRRVTETSVVIPWWVVPVVVFAVGRLMGALLIVLLADGNTGSGDRGYAAVVTSADGEWYRQIASHGYPTSLPVDADGTIQQNPWVFFPLYPVLVRGVMLVGLPFALAASVVSLLCGAAAFVVLYRLVSRRGGHGVALVTLVALTAFPAAPAFQLAYTESTALLGIALVLESVDRSSYRTALVWLGLLALTRPIVIAFAPVFALGFWLRWRRRSEREFPTPDRVGLAVLTVSSAALFAVWPVAAGLITGRPDAYVATQRAWFGRLSAQTWQSWFDVARSGTMPAITVMVVLTVGLGGLVLGRRAARAWGTGPRLFAASYLLYLVLTTRPTPSIFRYAMLAIVPWWPLPEVAGRLSRRHLLVLCSVIGAVGVVAQYWWTDQFLLRAAGPTTMYP